MSEKHLQMPDWVLDASERTQHAIGKRWLGARTIRLFVGDDPAFYEQRLWFSHNLTADVPKTATVPKDDQAGLLPRSWHNAAILSSPTVAYNNLKYDLKSRNRSNTPLEAIGYQTGDKWRIGISAWQGPLFTELVSGSGNREMAAAMRIGPGALKASLGFWLPRDRQFFGMDMIKVVEPKIPKVSLPQLYPNMKLS
ncbi:MAG TPA: hypothetical protein VFN51_01495 [Candidatus Saccharimonadales bacterium]|nr:hypothetical protein [Candidatus Saccharimonadales bacterium]